MILESFLIGGLGIKYVCSVCAYTYDDDAEEVPFDELPDDWTCPVCTADKEFFEAEGADGTVMVEPSQSGARTGTEDLADYLSQWRRDTHALEGDLAAIQEMAITGHSILEPMRTTKPVISWDEILICGAQLATLPLNETEAVSTRTVIGPKAAVPLVIDTPVYVSHISYGALSREIKTALMAAGCQQYRICHTGKCPVGITTQDPELRARLKIDLSARRLENFLNSTTHELEDFARLTGRDDVHDLSTDDLRTTSSEIATYTPIAHAGE